MSEVPNGRGFPQSAKPVAWLYEHGQFTKTGQGMCMTMHPRRWVTLERETGYQNQYPECKDLKETPLYAGPTEALERSQTMACGIAPPLATRQALLPESAPSVG